MTREKIDVSVNGVWQTLDVAPEKRLLDVLREDLHLIGTKRGCDGGQCGTCSVLINGELRRSCTIPIKKVAKQEIVTIEGLGTTDQLHPIQEAFIETGAIQCGFCTPGMIIATKALLDHNPRPSLEEVKKALSRNLCRCTGYVKIFDAVKLASRRLTGSFLAHAKQVERNVVGENIPMLDAIEKATGVAQFGDDLFLPGMLYGKVVRSSHAHAEIIEINTNEASAMPGVHDVITAADITGPNIFGRFVRDMPVLCQNRVRFVGDPIVIVVAETERQAAEACARVRVNYNPLPAVLEAEEACAETAPKLHPAGNICSEKRLIAGDTEKGFRESDCVLQRTYVTHFVEHAYMEPEAGVGYIDEEGRLVVAAGTQSAHLTRKEVAYALGLKEEEVRIIQTKTGGGFGGKHDYTIHALLALSAWKLRCPVKIRYSRKESMATTSKRHPFIMRLKVGAKKNGDLCAIHADNIANTGAYAMAGPGVFTRALLHTTGPYYFPHVNVSVTGVYTNNPPGSGFRGFGGAQVQFAIESLFDELAQELGLDPWELRYRNAWTSDHVLPTGHPIPGNIEIRRCLEAIKPHYEATKANVTKKNRNSHGVRYGVGLAGGMYGIGMTGIVFPGRARVSLEGDGTLIVRAGVADVGQGTVTSLAQIAAEEFGIPFDRVRIFSTDTSTEPDSGPSAASRQTFFTGKVICGAVNKLRESILEVASQILERKIDKVALAYSDEGDFIIPEGDSSLSIPISDFVKISKEKGILLEAEDVYNAGLTHYDHVTGRGRPYPAYTYAAQVAEVALNEETGKIDVLRTVVAQDVGRAINPRMVEGQLEGCIVMGLGWALKEKFIPGKTESFADYHIPQTTDVPDITTILLENDEPGAPFGAKGVGEAAIVPTSPAIASAMAHITGVRFHEIPLILPRLVRNQKQSPG